jgi:hypothetical protein
MLYSAARAGVGAAPGGGHKLFPAGVLFHTVVKRRAGSLFAICALVVVGIWLERYLLVVPSV